MNIEKIWNELKPKKVAIENRAREASSLTIPSVLPPENHQETQSLKIPYQSLGARGVTNLASKLNLSLLPPNTPFFKLDVSDYDIEEASAQRSEVLKALNNVQLVVQQEVEKRGLRKTASEMWKNLIITGNALFHIREDTIKTYRFDQWVCQRDGAGNLLKWAIKEQIGWDVLTQEQKEIIINNIPKEDIEKYGDNNNNSVNLDIFTGGRYRDGKWYVQQEILGVAIWGRTYKKEDFPFFFLRWTALPGESYGRGMIEDYWGDLVTLEILQKALNEGSIASSTIWWLIKPDSILKPQQLKTAQNGEILPGNPGDVSAVQLDKLQDFSWIIQYSNTVEKRLQRDFLMIDSIQRNAERVTAEEIRKLSEEIETALGGVFSLLAYEFQLPLAKFMVRSLAKKGLINRNILQGMDLLDFKIVTGWDALGRTQEYQKLITLLNTIAPLASEGLQYLNVGEYINRVASALGIETGLVKSQETLDQEQQQQLMQQFLAQHMQQQQQQTQSPQGGI